LLLIVLGGCAGEVRATVPRPNLLLISVDTLRPDHLGAYGAPRPTPGMDGLAASGVRFDQAWSASSWTLPGLATAMTGHHARSHGAVDDKHGIAAEVPLLAEHLSAAGYSTHGIGSHIFLDGRYGLQRGFETFDQELVLRHGQRRESHSQISSDKLSTKARTWLEGDHDDPWFLWVHYFDPHELYQDHGELTLGSERIDLYEGEVAFTDRHITRLLEHPKVQDSNTVVVLIADHGEEFGEHGGLSHRRTLYQEVLAVPLIIRAPGFTPRVVHDPVSLVDLVPTLCEVLDLAPPPALQGRSLVPGMRGRALVPAAVLAELEGKQPYDAVRLGDWKLVVNSVNFSHELYDLGADPGEQVDLATQEPERCADLLTRMQHMLDAAESMIGSDVELNAQDRANLDDLGYGGNDD
jgi:arylsulfatase A-like enzyme